MKKLLCSRIGRVLAALVGVLMIAFAVRILVVDLGVYIGQLFQKSWPQTAAVVQTVEKEDARTPASSRHTYYDIYYTYTVDGAEFDGALLRQNLPRQEGDTFTVKYDPDHPEQSTVYLSPAAGFWLAGGIGFLLFAGIGVRMLLAAFPPRIWRAHSQTPPTET